MIKVELPVSGDDSRGWGPPFVGPDDEPQSTYFLSANRNKESVTADLTTADGKDVLRRLLSRADVLLENFRPGALDRLGFSNDALHELNPRLVIVSITGFGHDGPEGGRPGYDQIAQGEAGLMSITGPDPSQPTKVGLPIGDLPAGMYAAYGAVAALYERGRTGCGRVVRTSLLAAIVGTHAFQGTRWTIGGQVPVATGNHNPTISPYGLYHTADRPVQVACGSEGLSRAFAPLVDVEADDQRFATNRLRVVNRNALTAEIDKAFRRHHAAYWLARLDEVGIPAGKIRALDHVYSWEQTRSQGLIVEVDHPTAGRLALPGAPLRFDDLPYAGGRQHHLPPPRIGEHNDSVRAWLDDLHGDTRAFCGTHQVDGSG